MSQTQTFDASIPVLTEVLTGPAEERVAWMGLAKEAAEAWASMPEPAIDGAEAAQLKTPAQAVQGWSDAQWDVLERRLSECISRQMQDRIGFVVERHMADVLHRALEDLSSEISNGLQQTIEKIVARAVSEELTHLKTRDKH